MVIKKKAKGKVLLIDDNEDMATIGEQVFIKAGYEKVSLSQNKGFDTLKMIYS